MSAAEIDKQKKEKTILEKPAFEVRTIESDDVDRNFKCCNKLRGKPVAVDVVKTMIRIYLYCEKMPTGKNEKQRWRQNITR